MPFLLRWRSGEISLREIGADGSTAAEESPRKADLDFELSPQTLISETERARLVEALRSLRISSSIGETPVVVEIPSVWGIGLRLPPLKLPPAELAEHVKWELSSALLDPIDQYRYHYTFAEDGAIRLAAVRSRLLDLIQQSASEAGYTLSGVRFDDADFTQINLLEASAPPRAVLPLAAPPPQPKPDQPRKEKSQHLRREPTSGQPSWFFGLIIIAGIIVVALWGWMKLTSEKRPGGTGRQAMAVREAPPEKEITGLQTPPDTASMNESLPRDTTSLASSELAAEPPPQAIRPPSTRCAPMMHRLAVIQQVLGDAAQPAKIDLISFTGDRFLIQMAPEPQLLRHDEICDRLKALPGVLEIQESELEPGRSAGFSLNGRLKAGDEGQAGSALSAAQIVAAGRKHHLEHPPAPDLIFAGAMTPMMSFLSEIAAQNGAIYRLILVPWVEGQYRVALEL